MERAWKALMCSIQEADISVLRCFWVKKKKKEQRELVWEKTTAE